jgi:allantoate deiminase
MAADRVIADLRELDRLTGGRGGARRVCWTDEWVRGREFLRARLDEIGVGASLDEAGNLWAELPGEVDEFVIVGSHLDSVPGGGWLDGALGVFAGLEVLRGCAGGARPAVGLRLVDWADEEGARFGRSLFGSSLCAGTLDVDAVRDLRDRDGERLEDVVGRQARAATSSCTSSKVPCSSAEASPRRPCWAHSGSSVTWSCSPAGPRTPARRR